MTNPFLSFSCHLLPDTKSVHVLSDVLTAMCSYKQKAEQMKTPQPWTSASHPFPLDLLQKQTLESLSHYRQVSVTSSQVKVLTDSMSFAYLSSKLSFSCQILWVLYILERFTLICTMNMFSSCLLSINFYSILPCKCSLFSYNQSFW